jgi:hypothetical protein
VPCVTKQRESRNLPVCVVAPIAARPPAQASYHFWDFRAKPCGSPGERKRSRPKPQAARMRCVISVPVAAASCMVATSEKTINSRSTPAPWMILLSSHDGDLHPRSSRMGGPANRSQNLRDDAIQTPRCARRPSHCRCTDIWLHLASRPGSKAREPPALEVNFQFVGRVGVAHARRF